MQNLMNTNHFESVLTDRKFDEKKNFTTSKKKEKKNCCRFFFSIESLRTKTELKKKTSFTNKNC